STDNTLAIVNEYAGKIAHITSEKDGGIYYALNKGISYAHGDVVAFLHADDVYARSGIISAVMKTFESRGCDAVYGDLQYVDRIDTNKVVRNWKSGEYRENIFCKGWMPPHPSFFLKKSCYVKYGSFNTTFQTAADYELMLRMLHKNHVSVAYLPEVIVKMRMGGVSNKTFANRLKANREDKRAWYVNGLRPGLFTLYRKPLSKIGQYFG
ncbi:MAG TPA: glycosyltransferase family 2 protein, partial [Bacteroidia bacterium]|nr:glycosyltransferase family 2 protein [Bacteroidia bacterium]